MNGAKLRGLRLATWALVLFLVIQFVAGIVLNLYVKIPPTIPGSKPGQSGQVFRDIGWALAHGAVALRIHVAIGIILVAASLAAAGYGIASRRAVWVMSTVIGAVLVLTGAEGGIGFLAGGGHSFDSLLMALSFMGAFLAYGTGLYLARDPVPEFADPGPRHGGQPGPPIRPSA